MLHRFVLLLSGIGLVSTLSNGALSALNNKDKLRASNIEDDCEKGVLKRNVQPATEKEPSISVGMPFGSVLNNPYNYSTGYIYHKIKSSRTFSIRTYTINILPKDNVSWRTPAGMPHVDPTYNFRLGNHNLSPTDVVNGTERDEKQKSNHEK